MTNPHHISHEHRPVSGGIARATVFGVSDGLVSNISLILGVAGGGVSASVVRLAGFAGLVSGAISMAAGEYVSVSAQNEMVMREVEVERREMSTHPEAETAELAKLYERKGVQADRARAVADDIMRDPDKALLVHAREELGVDPEKLASPWWTAIWSFIAFAIGALLPLIPWFVASGTSAKLASLFIGVVAAAIVGALIGKYAERNMFKTALRQVGILVLACGTTYLIGTLIGTGID